VSSSEISSLWKRGRQYQISQIEGSKGNSPKSRDPQDKIKIPTVVKEVSLYEIQKLIDQMLKTKPSVIPPKKVCWIQIKLNERLNKDI